MFSSERAPKMLKNEPLDVQKLADTAENEPLQVPEIWKTVGLWVHYGCSVKGGAGDVAECLAELDEFRTHLGAWSGPKLKPLMDTPCVVYPELEPFLTHVF